jgi:hypothetical protein
MNASASRESSRSATAADRRTGPIDPPAAEELASVDRVALYRAAREALDIFVSAPDLARRARVLNRPDDVALLPATIEMTDVRHVATAFAREAQRHQTTFRIATPHSERDIFVIFDHTPAGPRTDVTIFLEQWEGRLEKFLATRDAPPQRFHVVLDLTHSFEVEAPDSANFLCVRLLTPAGDELKARAYASLNSPEGAALERRMRWGEPYRVRVELSWSPARPDTGAPAPFLRISDVAERSW